MYNLAQKTIDSIQKQGHTIYKQEILESITSKSLIWKDDITPMNEPKSKAYNLHFFCIDYERERTED